MCHQRSTSSSSLRPPLLSPSSVRVQKSETDCVTLPQEQAVEREHEREDFQQEIQRLEEQLRQAARLQAQGPRESEVSQGCLPGGDPGHPLFLKPSPLFFPFHVRGNHSRHSWARR